MVSVFTWLLKMASFAGERILLSSASGPRRMVGNTVGSLAFYPDRVSLKLTVQATTHHEHF